MLHGIQRASAKNLALIHQQEVIANNLANAATTGFKRDRVEFHEEVQGATDRLLGGGRGAERLAIGGKRQTTVAESETDWTGGALRETGAPLDLALAGEGFFAVETREGVAYTRGGHFHVDETGLLVDRDGNRVLTENGPLRIEGIEVSFGREGDVLVDGEHQGRLRIERFEEPYPLVKAGDTIFRATPGAAGRAAAGETVVRQGFLEASNVEPVKEMVDMMVSFRAFEAGMKAVKAQDDTLDRAINDVGRT